MNKKVLFAGIVALSGAFSAFAQQPQQNQVPCCAVPTCTEQACPAAQGPPVPCDPFCGITLTEQQQAQIKALQQEKQAARQAAKKENADRKVQARQQSKNARVEELAKIKSILTPEQYVTFLENSYLNGAQAPQQARQAQFRQAGKFDKSQAKVKKGDKCDKSQKSDKAKKDDKSKK